MAISRPPSNERRDWGDEAVASSRDGGNDFWIFGGIAKRLAGLGHRYVPATLEIFENTPSPTGVLAGLRPAMNFKILKGL